MRTLFFILILASVGLTGCSRNPSIEISGSFFPAWMISILIGVLGTFICHRIFVGLSLDPYLKPHLMVYGALAVSLILTAWLILYS
jgi:hypothetical protein